MTKGYLILETGETFEGDWIGSHQVETGEVVFNTSMTGYHELMTDPSNAGQILAFSYPLIGNGGINDVENKKIAVSAVIISEVCDDPSHYQATSTLAELLEKASVPGLQNVDTRSLVTAIRKHGTVQGKLASEKELKTIQWEHDDSLKLIKHVSVKENETYGNGDYHVVLIDFGYKQEILEKLLDQNCRVTIVPFDASQATIDALDPDGILISNGPGDPMEMTSFLPAIKALTEKYPALGIGLGHQLIALAYGAKTRKMPVGHRGNNYPVKDMQTGKVFITAQNHGFEVIEESIEEEEFAICFRNVNDKSVEGMKHVRLPVQTVQFNPEAQPGPSDTVFIFNQFIQQVTEARRGEHVKA